MGARQPIVLTEGRSGRRPETDRSGAPTRLRQITPACAGMRSRCCPFCGLSARFDASYATSASRDLGDPIGAAGVMGAKTGACILQ